MKESFDILLNEYLLNESKTTNKTAEYHIEFINKLPQRLYSIFSKDEYKIKASDGNGNRSSIPWLCIFDKRITNTAQRGVYICYLFKSDMSGFYLTLTQGFTQFERLYGKSKFDYAELVSKKIMDMINQYYFSLDKINLSCNNVLAKGYQSTTIISKYYEKNNYNEKELLADLTLMKNIYKQLADSIEEIKYEELIDNIVNNFDVHVIDEEERKEIERQLLESSGENQAIVRTLERVDFPSSPKKKTSTRVVDKPIKKIDYMKKAKRSIETGVSGEMLVLDYERERLRKIGYDDLANNVRWIASEDDSKGYDIESYDVDKKGNVKKIYIEVKTTESGANSPFFISKNEKEQMDEYKEDYYIYRVCNISTNNPSLFVISYKDFNKKIKIDAELFKARIEY